MPILGHSRWTELNIGPFYVYTEGDLAAARDDLTQLEQLRWVLGGLLDTQDLPSLWPFRIILTKDERTNPAGEFVSKWGPLFGQRGFVWKSGAPLPLADIAGMLLDDNTPRLPVEAESGLRQLLGSIEAHGSRVEWGGPVPHPDLAWARMQLFATKFEYSASFHIFVTSLRNGSSIRVAERNAFNRDPDTLEKEAAANLAAGRWEAVSVSGRPLDPKRDLGEHSIEEAILNAYLAADRLDSDPKVADAAFKAAVEAGGPAKALGYEGLARLAQRDKQDPTSELENAMHAGSSSAPLYYAAADNVAPEVSLSRLKQSAALNPRWAMPIHAQVLLATDPVQKEALLKKAVQLAPRETSYWLELAELQMTDGHAAQAQSTWLRAEDSAATPGEKDNIHNLRIAREQERLDAAEAERKRERDEARLSDEKAEEDEMARIRAAEAKANSALDSAAGGQEPQNVVPWQDTVPKHNVSGTLLNVACMSGSDVLSVRDRAGHTLSLLLTDASKLNLTCGKQQPARRVTVSYAAQPDDRRHTEGQILSLELK